MIDKIMLGVLMLVLLVGFWVLERAALERNRRRKQINDRLAELGVAYRNRRLTIEESDELQSLYEEMETLR